MKNTFDATISYWDKILESYGKQSLTQKKPESIDKIQNDDSQAKDLTDFDDVERNPYGVFSPDLMNAGMKNGFANTWFITYPEWQYKEDSTFPREDLEEYPKEEFLDSCADNVIAEAHDIVHQTAMLVGPMLYVDNIANWARGYDGNGETYVSFEPDFDKSTVTLVAVQYGSYDGFVFPLDFASKAAQQSLLDDIYEMMPYLQAFETADAKNISFKIPREMMNELYDNYLRRPFKWEWTKDLKHKKEVKQSQEDKMWKDRNPHVANKAQEIDAVWKAHDKKEI